MYSVYYAVVEVLGQGDETKMIRFIVFPNGSTFEFYGMRGSLRHVSYIDGFDVERLQLLQPHNRMSENDDDIEIIYSVFSKRGMLSHYAKQKEHIICCGQLSSALSQSFAQCMKHTTHAYASREMLAVFDAHTRYI